MSAGVNENKDPFDRKNAKGSAYDKIYFTDEELKRGQEILDQADKGQISWESAHNWWESTRAGHGYTGGEDGHGYTKLGQSNSKNAPAYVNQYKDIMDQAVGAVMGREKFTYDPEKDPAYQQYADAYTRMGQKAMDDTLGEVSARTGGLASSYATTAAQQTYDDYAAQLAAKVPELRQLAYQMYMDEGNEQRQNLQMLQNLEQTAYGRYRDEMADSQWQQNFDRGVFESDRDYNYKVGRDRIEDERYDEKWKYGVEQDIYNREQDEKNAAREQIMQALTVLGMSAADLDPKLKEISGFTDAEVMAMEKLYKDNQKPKGTSSGGGGQQDYDGLFEAAYDSRDPKSFIANNYKKYGFTSSTGLFDAYQKYESKQFAEVIKPSTTEQLDALNAASKDVGTGTTYGKGAGIGVGYGTTTPMNANAGGAFTYNGVTYGSVEELVDAFAATNPTDAQIKAFEAKYLKPLGISFAN